MHTQLVRGLLPCILPLHLRLHMHLHQLKNNINKQAYHLHASYEQRVRLRMANITTVRRASTITDLFILRELEI